MMSLVFSIINTVMDLFNMRMLFRQDIFFRQTVSVPWVERAENNEKKIEYLEDNVQDPVLKAGLLMSYSMFKVVF